MIRWGNFKDNGNYKKGVKWKFSELKSIRKIPRLTLHTHESKREYQVNLYRKVNKKV